MPNALAYLVLFTWPLVIVFMFRRLSTERALIWSILGGYLFLPPNTGIDPPLVPILDKMSVPTLTACVVCLNLIGRSAIALPNSKLARLLLVLFIFAPFGTALTNAEPIFFARGGLSGLTIYDAISFMIKQIITVLPFILAANLLATVRAQREILVALVVAGLIYSVPMLIEVRLSPQLNVWIYGFFQHSFEQMMRYGGFRPIVFLEHGLWVAFFAFMTYMSALTLTRLEPREERGRYLMVTIYLAVVLVLCKSASVLIYALAMSPLILIVSTKLQIRLAGALVLVVVTYPLLRYFNLIPLEPILDLARSIDDERGRSLTFRIQNEEMLLEHAYKKAMFGWGEWGRNHVYDYNSGDSLSTIDGHWIVTFGVKGWIGFLGEFGLLSLPMLILTRQAARLKSSQLSAYAGPISLILGANLLDLLPNATLIPFTWLMAGALLGYAEALKRVSEPVYEQTSGYGFKRGAKADIHDAKPAPGVDTKRKPPNILRP